MGSKWLTSERIVAMTIITLNVLVASLYATVSSSLWFVVLAAFALSLPGLVIIWFRDALSTTGFKRGVLRESPPKLLDAIGWLFLVGLPVIFLYGLLP